MTPSQKNKSTRPHKRPKPSSKRDSLTLENLILDGSLPRVKVKVYPSRNRSPSKPNERLVIELQCEV